LPFGPELTAEGRQAGCAVIDYWDGNGGCDQHPVAKKP
jgi:hypothetical protein